MIDLQQGCKINSKESKELLTVDSFVVAQV